MMKSFKKYVGIAFSVVAIVAFVGCEEQTDPPLPGDGELTDTIYAMTVIHPEGWSPMIDTGEGLTSTATVTGAAGESATIDLQRCAQPNSGAEPWPQADMLGAMGTGSLAKLKKVVIQYTINSIDAAADGLSFSITDNYNTDLGEDGGWARFHAVLTAGGATPVVGTQVTDTLDLEDFFISWESTNIPGTETLAGTIGQEYLARCNSINFSSEHDTEAATALNFTIDALQLIGEAGLKNDMNIAN